MCNINCKRYPEIFRNPVLKIGLDLSNAVRDAAFNPKALELVEFFIGIADFPAIEIDYANAPSRGINQISRVKVSMQIDGLLFPDLVNIVPYKFNGSLVSVYPDF